MTSSNRLQFAELIAEALDDGGKVTFVSGAGISAESGIRTYRGEGGLWAGTDGAAAMTKSTYSHFVQDPAEVWQRTMQWRDECAVAVPNEAHLALAHLQAELGERFALVTQNIDGLHRQAGNHGDRFIEMHGAIELMRCLDGCRRPQLVDDSPYKTEFGPACPLCEGRTRPHVLWFDEFYDEENYGARTAQSIMARTSVLVTVGTSGALPMVNQMARIAARAGAVHIDVNPENNPLREYAAESGGASIAARSTVGVPYVVEAILEATS